MMHHFHIEDARLYGVIEATMVNNLQFWIHCNKANGVNLHEGRTWSYNSVTALASIYPYLTKDQIRRALERLIEVGVLMVAKLSTDPRDRTNWYAFTDEEKALSRICNWQKTQNTIGENAKSLIKKDKNTDKGDLSGKPDPVTILDYLNAKAGRQYRPVRSNIDFIKARLKEGATEADMRAVVDTKVKEWKGDPKMDAFLRPATLFNATNFAQYIGQLGQGVSKGGVKMLAGIAYK